MHWSNLLAVALAGTTSFMLGGLWYSPKLFGDLWNREAGRSSADKPGHPAKVFGAAYVLSLVGAFALSQWLGPDPTIRDAVFEGLKVGALFVATSFGINYAFGGRSFTLWCIDAGYHVLQFMAYGLVLGLMDKLP